MNNDADTRQLLNSIWKLHSVLSVIWPKPGVPMMAGASTFFGTDFFKSLETGIRQIDEQLNSYGSNDEVRKELCDFWHVVHLLYLRLKTQNRLEKSVRIDNAINLLYLASGVFYHRIKEMSSITIDLAPGFSDVEGLEKLLNVCNWMGRKTTIQEIENGVMAEMNTLLETLPQAEK